jgi:hypothetical protein
VRIHWVEKLWEMPHLKNLRIKKDKVEKKEMFNGERKILEEVD